MMWPVVVATLEPVVVGLLELLYTTMSGILKRTDGGKCVVKLR